MSENPPASGPYGPPPGSGQPYGQPAPQAGGYPGQPAYGTPYGPPGGYGGPPARSKKWYQRWWVWLIAVIALVIIGLVIFGLLRGNKYVLESKIRDLGKDQGITITNVDCPDTIDTDAGNQYDCTADVDGTQRTLHVNFTRDRFFVLTQK